MSYEDSRLRIARNVAGLRKRLGISQAVLAEAAGMHRSYVGDIENAERNVSIDNIDRLAIALGVDAVDLLASGSGLATKVQSVPTKRKSGKLARSKGGALGSSA